MQVKIFKGYTDDASDLEYDINSWLDRRDSSIKVINTHSSVSFGDRGIVRYFYIIEYEWKEEEEERGGCCPEDTNVDMQMLQTLRLFQDEQELKRLELQLKQQTENDRNAAELALRNYQPKENPFTF